MEGRKPKLSLAIATYNRGGKLWKTLMSLALQELDRTLWELVVVDNNSTDDTAEVFRRFAAENPDLDCRMVVETRQGVSWARNRGVEEAVGEYVVFIDDDEEAVPGFLKEYYDFFETYPDAMAAGGRILPRYEAALPRWFSRYTERAIVGTLDLGEEIKPFPKGKFFGGGNHGVRRSVYDKYGMYKTDLGRTGKLLLGGEEKDLYMRFREAGLAMYYLPGAAIYHLIPPERLTREYFLGLCYQIGRSEKVRTLGASKVSYLKRLFTECVKWGGAVVLALGYLIALRPAKGWYLILMRAKITRGLFAKTNR